MSRDIENLKEPFRTSVKELIKQAKEAGIPAFVTDTTRTLKEQRELVKKGYSKTLKSKHLIGEAVDIAFLINGELSYSKTLYTRLYKLTKDIPYIIWPYNDLKWKWDWPHHQYDKNKKPVKLTTMQKEEYENKIRELNTEIGEVTRSRDSFQRKLFKEVGNHAETLDKLNHCEGEREEIAGQRNKAAGLLEKIKGFFT